MTLRQKWFKENGILFPIPGDTTIRETPGNGVFQIHEERTMGGSRLGLRRIGDEFVFDFKLYDLGAEDIIEKVVRTWNSEIFKETNKNLGVIFNGLKGTGKTIASKVLSNRTGLPVIIVQGVCDGLLSFISSLSFECVVLIDEAEKTFREHGDVLLKMIDGVYNETRKLYIMTTNHLSIDENLIGRPGRVRYIKQFGNLTAKAVTDFIADNLTDKSKTPMVLNQVDLLEISTIDILKSIVEEVNIQGEIGQNSMLNIPKSSFRVDVMKFSGLNQDKFDEFRTFIIDHIAPGQTIGNWLKRKWENGEDKDDTNEDLIEDKFDCYCNHYTVAMSSPRLYQGMSTRIGEIMSNPDQFGFFLASNDYDNSETLCCVLVEHAAPSLYRGGLQSLYS